ncbi:MAG: mscL [Verrucomicrobiales bacterium]|nr:mscL [Verrucomicrobiales bacterium]
MSITKKTREELEKELEKTKGFISEFKQFAMRGNVIDLAVGVVIGGAFGAIVNSLVKDLIMPPLSKLTGEVDLSQRFWDLSGKHFNTLKEAVEAKAPVITYGVFLNTIISFLIIAFAVFMLVRFINKLHPKPAPTDTPTPTTKECPFCVSTISLKATRCPQCTSQLM